MVSMKILPPWFLKKGKKINYLHFLFRQFLGAIQGALKKNIDALNKLANVNLSGIDLFGPVPASVAKKGGNYFHQIILQSPSRKNLSKNLELIFKKIQADKRSVKWVLDIDPVEY